MTVVPPVPPETTGRARFKSAAISSIVLLYLALSITVFGTAVVPAGLLYTPLPLRGIVVFLYFITRCLAGVNVVMLSHDMARIANLGLGFIARFPDAVPREEHGLALLSYQGRQPLLGHFSSLPDKV